MSSSTSTIIEVVNLAPTGAEKCKSVEEYDSASSRDILGRQGMSFDKYKFKPLNFGVSQLIIASDGHWSGAEMVIIISGAEKKPFAVHRTLLVEKCSYFKAALSENFMEGQSKVIRWPEVSSDIVAYFPTWLYSGDIRNEDKLGQPLAKVSFGTLTKLYIFAIRYSITALSDASCKQITKTLQHWDRFDGLDSDFPNTCILSFIFGRIFLSIILCVALFAIPSSTTTSTITHLMRLNISLSCPQMSWRVLPGRFSHMSIFTN